MKSVKSWAGLGLGGFLALMPTGAAFAQLTTAPVESQINQNSQQLNQQMQMQNLQRSQQNEINSLRQQQLRNQMTPQMMGPNAPGTRTCPGGRC